MPNEVIRMCQRILPNGQCQNEARQGTDRCDQHTTKTAKSKNSMQQYRLNDARVSVRVQQFLESDRLYSLAEEIAISKQLLEQFAGALTMDSSPERVLELTLRAPMIVKLLETIQKLVTSGVQTELKVGSMMTKETALRYAQRMVEILSDEISHIDDYQLIVDTVMTRFADELKQIKNNDTQTEGE